MTNKSTHESRVNSLMARKKPEQITTMEQQFVLEYLCDLNMTQAAIRAGYDPMYASRVASKMMKRGTLVNKAVAQAMAARAARTGMNADRVLREIGKVAFGDPRKMFDEAGRLLPPSEYDEDDAAMLAGVKTRRIVEKDPNTNELVQVEIQEVRLASKTESLTLLARHLGILNDKIDININGALSMRLDQAFQRTGQQRTLVPDKDAIDGEFEEVEEVIEEMSEDEQRVAQRLVSMNSQEAMVRELLFGPSEDAEQEAALDLDFMLGRKS